VFKFVQIYTHTTTEHRHELTCRELVQTYTLYITIENAGVDQDIDTKYLSYD